jgi:capsular exopolysaccharide synthesis family protein
MSRIVSIAALLGFVGAFGLGYLIDLSDKRFRSAAEIQQLLHLPLVGHIPGYEPAKPQELVSDQLDGMLVTAHLSSSQESEAYRAVRTALYFSTRGAGHQVIQITSPMPGDGKTTTAVNLAITIAQSNKSVLLVDADFRRSRVHKLFGLGRRAGLTTVIDGRCDPLEAVQPTQIENLQILSAGPPTRNPSELLTSTQFEEVLGRLRERFEFVIIDSPPMLAVTDATAVAPRVDGTLLVLRLDKRSRTTARRAGELLDSVGAHVLGVIVNGVGSSRAGSYYGYGGYGYSGSYKLYGYVDRDAKKYFAAENDPADDGAEVGVGGLGVKTPASR